MKIRMAVGLLFVMSFCQFALAHPPSDIEVEFSIISHDLTATIVHHVEDPEMHYIDSIKVTLNNQVVIQDSLKKQDNNNSMMVIYNIQTAGLGDTITIYAHCNEGGDMEKTITVM